MAELVLGAGTSHSPMLTLEGRDWLVWAQRDIVSTSLFDERGANVRWEDRAAAAGDAYRDLITVERCDEARERSRLALDELATRFQDARPDAVVIIGDDQDEHLLPDNLPALLVYWGESIHNAGAHEPNDRSPVMQRFIVGYQEDGPARDYPVASALALHIIDRMLDDGIDVASARTLPVAGRGMGHAFGFPLRRIIPEGVPVVPIMLNTYVPPNRPRAARCIDYGRSIRAAIDCFDGGRIAVLASGGLSHFLVLAELDGMVIDACRRGDLGALAAIPEVVLQSGTSEIKSWIVVAAACNDCTFELIDYVPAYRTLAGSGTGLAFATWSCPATSKEP